jgi:Tfp pilus assembly protein PilF
MLKALSITGCLLALAGCAAAPVPPVVAMPEPYLWRDQEFGYDAARISVGKQDLFALDAELLSMLAVSGMKEAGTQTRVDYLVSLLFGPDLKAFPYAGDQSNIAAETWRLKRGNCLSLSVLAYSMARALNLPVQLQEVRVPQFFDRHGRVDFVGRHVNVLIRNEARLHLKNGTMTSGNVVIDFEPQAGWLRAGTALSEESVLARYYNNVAADYFARDNLAPAYAWFKAAILADPGYASSYSNLAQLYRRKGLVDHAERLLAHAIALDGDDDTPMRSMHLLLVSQGREGDAAKYAALLRDRQEKNPYYWLGLGLDYLRDAEYPKAVSALEHAEALTTGFDEVHRNLAIAYWQNGNPDQARKQLAVLASLLPPGVPQSSDPAMAALNRKISKPPGN